jgi:hypothetical protein
LASDTTGNRWKNQQHPGGMPDVFECAPHLAPLRGAVFFYHVFFAQKLPNAAAVIPQNRPTMTNHMMAWETLTHADIGDIGLPLVAQAAEPAR